MKPVEAERAPRRDEHFLRHAEIDERGDGHVAREPARRIEEQDFPVARAARENPPRDVRARVVMMMIVIVMIVVVIVIVIVAFVTHHLLRVRRMRAAANAAPKPLSMFTTVTPDAQLVSMPSSAASP